MINRESDKEYANTLESKDKNNKYIDEIKYLMEYTIAQNNNNKENKISLYKIRGFDPRSIFNEIDQISSGIINSSDIDEFLSRNNIKIDKEIILLFIREFNKEGKDINLSIKDFISFLNYDINKNKINKGEIEYDKNIIHNQFLDLIKSEFILIKEKSELIREIKKIREFSTFEAFYIISNDNKYIDYDSLKSFLDDKYKKNEIKELIYRIDMNNDGKISYEEFQDMFFPFQKHLHFEETKDKDIYSINTDSKYDVVINYKEDYNLSPYKDNSFTEPKIIYYNINIEDDEDIKEENNNNINNISNSKSDIFLSSKQFEKKKLNSNNFMNLEDNKNDDNDKYDYDNLIIKYDEELIKEINQKEKDKNNENDYIYNYDNEKVKINSLPIHQSFIVFDDEPKMDDKIIENKNNQNNINQTQPKSESNLYKSDLFKSAPNLKNDYLNSNNSSQNMENEEKKESFNNNGNFSDIFTEEDKIIINLFIDYIHSISILENKSENIRESISLCNDISLIDIFEKFDINKNNLISKLDFREICKKEYFLFPNDNQIKLLYSRYDLDNDGNLNFEEFMNMISPLKKEYTALYEKEEKDNNIISFASKKKIIEFLKNIIDNEVFNYEIRTKLISNENFNFVILWGLLMKYSKDDQQLNKQEFNYFLESFGCYLTQYELDIIFFKFSKGKSEIRYDDLYKEIII